MKSSRKKVVAGFVLLVVTGLAGLWHGSNRDISEPEQYRYAEVERGDLELNVTATGKLSPTRTVDVGSQVSGIIEQVFVDHNDRVERGQLLALIDPETLDALVRDSRSTVERASARLDEAQSEYDRHLPLLEKGYISEREFIPLQTALRSARAELEGAHARLDRVLRDRRNAEIRSPDDGVVIRRGVDAGQTVAASLQAPTLFLIAKDLSRMEILVDVDETDISQVGVGQKVRFDVAAYPRRSFAGEVVQVRLQPSTVQNVVHYTVVVEADNEDRALLPGMTATVDFIVEQVEDSLLIPSAGLRFRPPASVMERLKQEREEDRGQDSASDTLTSAHMEAGVSGPEMAPPTRQGPDGDGERRRIWIPAGEGDLTPVWVRPLADDGFTAAIEVPHDSLKEGDQVVVGMTLSAREGASNRRSPLEGAGRRGRR